MNGLGVLYLLSHDYQALGQIGPKFQRPCEGADQRWQVLPGLEIPHRKEERGFERAFPGGGVGEDRIDSIVGHGDPFRGNPEHADDLRLREVRYRDHAGRSAEGERDGPAHPYPLGRSEELREQLEGDIVNDGHDGLAINRRSRVLNEQDVQVVSRGPPRQHQRDANRRMRRPKQPDLCVWHGRPFIPCTRVGEVEDEMVITGLP